MEATTKRPNDHGLFDLKCPNDHGPMNRIKEKETVTFRGKVFAVETEGYECPACKIKTATIKQSARTQKAISDAYKSAEGLLTSDEIRKYRKQLKLTQQALADKIRVGVASIKRWEKGLIQSKSMDQALRRILQCQTFESNYAGNRELSIPRIKLVMKEFEKELGFKFLIEGDMLLFDAKYSWYADMLGYEILDRSLTGSTYAALPHGPQLNNYKELVELIRQADLTEAEPLTEEEKKIIARVAARFPTKQAVIDAAHREKVWSEKSTGAPIPYSDACRLTEIAL